MIKQILHDHIIEALDQLNMSTTRFYGRDPYNRNLEITAPMPDGLAKVNKWLPRIWLQP
jgi:hypothetical protein